MKRDTRSDKPRVEDKRCQLIAENFVSNRGFADLLRRLLTIYILTRVYDAQNSLAAWQR